LTPKPPSPRPNAKQPSKSATYAKVAVVAASATFVTAKLVDVALIGSGVAAAAGSVVFAGLMVMQSEHAPRVNGLEYLSVFAAPKGTNKPSPASTDVAEDPPGIDTSPVGAISVPATTGRADYTLVSAQADRAWIRAGSRIFAVRPGDVLPNLGKIAAIVRGGGRWTLVGDRGEPLLTAGDGPDLANPKSVFAKPLILEGGKQ